MSRRAVITGRGVVSSAGCTIEEFATNVLSGNSFFSAIRDPRLARLRGKYAAFVNNFKRRPEVSSLYDMHVAFALEAACQAIADAGLSRNDFDSSTGLIFATCSGPMGNIEKHCATIMADNPALTADELFAKRYYSTASILAKEFNICGITNTVVTACSASLLALGIARDLIEAGLCEIVLTGGADAFSPTTFAGFAGLKATAEEICAPFSTPTGMNLGEGAAFLIVESRARARRRNAFVHAAVLGYGTGNDAYHSSAPDPTGKGQARAITRALQDAGLSAGKLTYVNAHGTGTQANDKAESRALQRALNEAAQQVNVSSTKSAVGHCLGAAGTLEVLGAIAACEKGVLPPNAQFKKPRSGCTLKYITQSNQLWSGDKIWLSNNFAFGGNNTSMILSRQAEESESLHRQGSEIYITGIGIYTPRGIGKAAFSKPDQPPGSREIAARQYSCLRFQNLDLSVIDRRLNARGLDRQTQIALGATRLALQDAGFTPHHVRTRETGLYLHFSVESTQPEFEHIGGCMRTNFNMESVASFPFIVPNAANGSICRAVMLTGHNATFCHYPDAGLAGLGMATLALKQEHAQSLISCSVDELSHRNLEDCILAGRYPRSGFPAEGSVAFMLESKQSIDQRNAKPIAEALGWAMMHTEDEQDSADLLAHCISRAITRSAIDAADITVVCAQRSEPRIDAALLACGISSRVQFVETHCATGIMESSHSTLNLACALVSSTPSPPGRQPHILTISSSFTGACCAFVARKFARV
ncbi:MAG: hypothetical protein GF398_05290 [Chitinivibrionales bacterium]|nr:hypothetical protein [Chitinivibrionales bacterium]